MVETGIGRKLERARKRRKIDLSEVEASTKIRRHYLRAIEDEEWGALPGPPYSRGFIRTYAAFLGLDGERLAEDFRQETGEPQTAEIASVAETTGHRSSGAKGGGFGLSAAAWAAIVSAGLVVALVALGLSSRGGGGSAPGPTQIDAGAARSKPEVGKEEEKTSPPRGISVRLETQAEVWVCLLDAAGRPLVNGQILGAGAREGPFHSGSFTVSFGNGEVSMAIDGQTASIPATSSPIGYAIDSRGRLQPLSETERPTCT